MTDTGLGGLTRGRALAGSARHRRFTLGGFLVFDPVEQAKPAMAAGEVDLFASVVRGAGRYLEFGAGGSTTFALRQGARNVVSVESDASWIQRLRADLDVAGAISDSRLRLLHADIGATGSLGRPLNREARDRWPNYARAPWAHLPADRLDAVLIDGRFRVACVMETVLRCGPHTAIIVHDFWNRPRYHAVLPYLTMRARKDSLGVFTVKAGFDRAGAAALLAASLYDFS